MISQCGAEFEGARKPLSAAQHGNVANLLLTASRPPIHNSNSPDSITANGSVNQTIAATNQKSGLYPPNPVDKNNCWWQLASHRQHR